MWLVTSLLHVGSMGSLYQPLKKKLFLLFTVMRNVLLNEKICILGSAEIKGSSMLLFFSIIHCFAFLCVVQRMCMS